MFKIRRTATPNKTDNKIRPSYTSAKKQATSAVLCYFALYCIAESIVLVTPDYHAYSLIQVPTGLSTRQVEHPQRGQH